MNLYSNTAHHLTNKEILSFEQDLSRAAQFIEKQVFLGDYFAFCLHRQPVKKVLKEWKLEGQTKRRVRVSSSRWMECVSESPHRRKNLAWDS